MSTDTAWAKYREQEFPPIEYKLDEIGLPTFWVKFMNLGAYSPSELHTKIISADKENWERLKILEGRRDKKAQELDKQLEAKEIDDFEYYVALASLEFSTPTILTPTERLLILEWNLCHPVTGEPLPLPVDNPNVLFEIPTAVQKHIKELATRSMEEAREVPKAK